MRRRPRIDNNHADIVASLRVIGCSVLSLAGNANGCPDILVGWRGKNLLLEIKGPKGSLTPDQVIWRDQWRGQSAVVTSLEEAVKVLGEM